MKIPVSDHQNPKTLTFTIALAFISLSVVVLLISGGMHLFSHIRTHRLVISNTQQHIAQDAANQVCNYIKNKFDMLETAVWLRDPMQVSRYEQKQFLESMLGIQPAFRQMALLTREGNPLSRVSRLPQTASGWPTGQLPPDALSLILQRKHYISPVYIDETTSEPIVSMAVPVINAFRDVQGILAVEVNLKFMWELVDHLRIGETGHAYVVDRQGNLIAFGDTARVLKGENVSHLKLVGKFIRNPAVVSPSEELSFEGINGFRVVGIIVPLQVPDWAVISELPWKEAYSPIIRDVAISLLIMLTVVFLSGVLGIYIARRLSIPLVGLMRTATRIAGGERELQAVVAGPREVAGLATAFNSMTAQLQKSLDDLEQRFTEQQQAEEALRESEERLRLALEATNDAIWDWNAQTGQVYFSPRYYTMLGYEPGEFPASYESWRSLLHPDDSPASDRIVQDHVSQHLGGFAIEFRMKAKNGEWRWILGRGTVVEWDSEGKAVRVAGSHSDITERKLAEEEKARLESQLVQAQKMESVGRLAGGVAHDFNNMLSIILGYAELLKAKMPSGDPLVQNVMEIEKAGRRARDVTRQLLAFSRKQIIAPRPVNLNDLINDTQKALARLIGEDIDLCFYPAKDLWNIQFDPSQVDQILMNLVINARDAMPDGGKLSIETTNVSFDESYCREHPEYMPGEYVMLLVSDSGSGMDSEVLSHIFEPFFTTKEVGKGTGLGLATVYGIVIQNNGFIKINSNPGQGTTCRIFIPRLSEEEAIEQTIEEPTEHCFGTVLLVEDDEMVRKMTGEMLKEMGYTVLISKDPYDALRICGNVNTPIDLLLTDVVMPSMKGTELRDRIQSVRPGIKVLFMSGYTSKVILHKNLQDGRLNFVQKPFSMKDLARKIQETIGNR